jgi:hypothetical protein
MLTALMHRLQLRLRRIEPARRTEVCPPALLRRAGLAAPGWRGGLKAWLGTGWNAAAPTRVRPAPAGLREVRDEFVQELADIRTQQAGLLLERIRIARSLRELWHLRPEVFGMVALCHSQAEAQTRLERLNRHFPTRSPRSGFGALDGGAAAGEARNTSSSA